MTTRQERGQRVGLAPPLAEMADIWYVSLEADGKSPQTVRAYKAGVAGFLAWYARQGDAEPVLDPPAVDGYLVDLRRSGASVGTRKLRFAALRLFSSWLASPEGQPLHFVDLLHGKKGPKGPEAEVDGLSVAQLEALIKACRGTRFADRRDEAIVRLMAETGLRAGGTVGIQVDDVDLAEREVKVTLKGGRRHTVGFGPKTHRALQWYLRERKTHRLAGLDAKGHQHGPLWLGEQGRPFGYQGLARALGIRAQRAGIQGFHPHRLRHTAAERWLDEGGTDGGAMEQFGWKGREQLDRYTKGGRARRAREEARRLNLGDIG